MLIPVAHENLRGRRWPYVTIAMIALNFVFFLATNWRMHDEAQKSNIVQLHILLLSAHHPDAPMTPDAAQLVKAFQHQHPGVYEQLGAPNRQVADAWDARQLEGDWRAADAEAQMAALCAEFDQTQQDSILWNYGFHPYHPKPWSYITASFLHGGWLHILFNMWFLWLAGAILEDAWGRVVYPMFYLLAGAVSLVVQSAIFPGSMVPVVGASGAIAGLMGGFLARFPRTKIELMWIWLLGLNRYKFFVPAYIILPAWLGIQVFWGMVGGNRAGGVAYWVHVGGFAFGMIGAVILRATGIEHAADQAIEAKVSWSPRPRLARAAELVERQQFGAAIAELRLELGDTPDSGDAMELLLTAQEKTQDFEGMKQTLAGLCRHYLGAAEPGTAWSNYERYLNLGGRRLPRGVWLQLCRYRESEQDWERAAKEYEKLAVANPNEPVAARALVAAASICLARLKRPDQAERLFKAAAGSPAPHLDSEQAIEEGLKQCAAAMAAPGAYGR